MDRLSPRHRPDGLVAMRQTWSHLAFLHWEVPAAYLRKLVPDGLTIDTFEGKAYVGVVPFYMSNIRLPTLPALPGVSSCHELNVRTYVHRDGVPGVWFFSLDADSALAVAGARIGFRLPYHTAKMSMTTDSDRQRFHSRRTGSDQEADFKAIWHHKGNSRIAEPGSLEFFLAERYCLYSGKEGALQRVRVHHEPYQIADGRVEALSSTMLEVNQIPTPEEEPLVHVQTNILDVEVFFPEKLPTP